MMNEESLKNWEQDNIELLTSREMGEWLHRRDMNRDMKERPQGEWITDNWGMFHCNYCMREKQQLFHNFCSYCGADMRGKEE